MQYHNIIMVAFSPTDGGLSEDQINHAGYIGSLTTNILLLIVIAIHLVFR